MTIKPTENSHIPVAHLRQVSSRTGLQNLDSLSVCRCTPNIAAFYLFKKTQLSFNETRQSYHFPESLIFSNSPLVRFSTFITA